jgi:NADPH-dependent 2,4-dienoyl-CoA reductase/sulfur reductase-like enzyme
VINPDYLGDPLREQKRQHLQDLAGSSVEVMCDTLVWDALPGEPHQLIAESQVLQVEKLILATGAHELVIPFPGWDIPGVMTAGAGLIMVRDQAVLPGTRVLVAGTGPLLIAAAASLVQAGCQVVAILDAYRGQHWWKGLWPGAANPNKVRQALNYARVLAKARVPYKLGHTVLEARGTEIVDRAIIVPVDRIGYPVRRNAQEVMVDTVCVSFGLQPSTSLAQIIGVRMHHDSFRGGWLPLLDGHMETTVPGIFVAGEAAGIGGADVALLQGRIAGLSAAHQLGLIDAKEYTRGLNPVIRKLKRAWRFSAFLNEAFSVRPGLHELTTDETVLCRCEDVTAGDVGGLLPYGSDLRSIKMASRIGMGLCQGRVCGPVLAGFVGTLLHQPDAVKGRLVARHPVRPMPLEAFLDD